MPLGDADYATRWGMIKRHVSMPCGERYKRPEWITAAKRKHRESTIWQRRYWEHQIRDERDFERHVDDVHYNSVKHGRCHRTVDWPYSTFHRLEIGPNIYVIKTGPGMEALTTANTLYRSGEVKAAFPDWWQEVTPR